MSHLHGDPLADPERLAALRAADLRDDSMREAFDRLTRLAARLLRVPVSLVSLVDRDRQYFPSCVGLPEPWASRRETPLSHSFCRHVVASAEPLVVEDAREHPDLADNLAIPDLRVVAYAGIPLLSPGGHVLGSFCAIDHVPRRWTEEEVGVLRDLAGSAMTEIALRERVREAEALAEKLRRSEGDALEVQTRAREEGARVRGILESTSEGIYGIDLEGRCTFVNRAAAEMLGYTPEELLGRDMHRLIHHTRPDGTPYPVEECPIAAVGRLARPVRIADEVLWRRDGTSFPAEYGGSPLMRDGRPVGTVVTITDITERKRAEAERERLLQQTEEARQRAEAALQTRDDVLGVVAHDLRNPVGTVFTAAAFLLEVPLPEETRTRQIELIRNAARRADRLIQDLLDIARIEAGSLAVERRPMRAGALLAEVQEWAPLQIGAGGHEAEIGAPPEVKERTVCADPDRVAQVFSNLVGNAVKFAPKGSRIAVGAEEVEGGIRFRVSNTGSTIPPEQIPHLFTRFWQAKRGDRRGAGLGLAIVKGIVDSLGGEVGVESTPTGGTTVWFTLPFAPEGDS